MLHPRCQCLPEIPKVGFLGQGQGRAGYRRIHSKVLGWIVLDFLVVGNLIYMPHANHQQKFTRQCMNVVSMYSISGRSSGNLPGSYWIWLKWFGWIQFWTSTAGGELGFTLSDGEEFLVSAFRFCFSCCTLKYELWMMHCFMWRVAPDCYPICHNFLFCIDLKEPRHKPGVYRSNHFFIVPSWESNFSHKRNSDDWVSDVRVPVETIWSFFYVISDFLWFLLWG